MYIYVFKCVQSGASYRFDFISEFLLYVVFIFVLIINIFKNETFSYCLSKLVKPIFHASFEGIHQIPEKKNPLKLNRAARNTILFVKCPRFKTCN